MSVASGFRGKASRTAASAASRGPSIRGSRSTTIAPSSHNTPGRTINASSGATEKFTIAFRVGGEDLSNPLRKLPGTRAADSRRVDRLVDDELHITGVRGQLTFQHHVPAADDRQRHDR